MSVNQQTGAVLEAIEEYARKRERRGKDILWRVLVRQKHKTHGHTGIVEGCCCAWCDARRYVEEP